MHGQDDGAGHDLVLQLVVIYVVVVVVDRQPGGFEAAPPQAARPTSGRMQRRAGREHRKTRMFLFQANIFLLNPCSLSLLCLKLHGKPYFKENH